MAHEMRNIEKVTRIGDLFDLYGTLLTQRQREMVQMYYFDDWSLSEIAEHLSVSRQAVHDNLRRAEEQLESYELALQLHQTIQSQRSLTTALSEAWMDVKAHVPEPTRQKMDSVIQALLAQYQ